MANNRMLIVCKYCGKATYIAKYYPSTGWFIPKVGWRLMWEGFSPIRWKLNDFFSEHYDCLLLAHLNKPNYYPNESSTVSHPECQFKIAYELPIEKERSK